MSSRSAAMTGRRRRPAVLPWLAAALACAFAALELLGPRLGGAEPGLPGPIGFASEALVALALPTGVVFALTAVILALRRRAGPALATLAAALAMLAPEALQATAAPLATAQSGEARLRVAAVNLQADNEADPAMPEVIAGFDADVVVLCEYSRAWERRLESLAASYPHRFVASAPGLSGMDVKALRIAIWSRLPPDGEPEQRDLSGINAQLRVPLRWAGRSFAMYAVHPWKPFGYRSYGRSWRERRALLDWLRAETLPAVVAGDFNAPPGSAFVLRLRRAGLRDAGAAVGGRAPGTWPMHSPLLAPFRIAIDHVMTTAAFAAVGFRRGPATGSDHAAICAELVWRG